VLPRRTKAAVPREIEAGLPVPAGLPAPVVEPAAAAAEVTAREEPLEVAPAAAVPDAPTGLSQGELRAYARAVRAELVRHRRYPPAALRLGLEGVAKVELAIDRRGSLVGAPRVIQSSGHAVLDEEALRVVEAAAPFVAPPQHGDKDVLVFVIPIDFRLSGD
jgi:protein TonB